MEEVLKDAARLLQDGDPEQALRLLNEVKDSTLEYEQLKAACKRMLSQQYMYLLREAQKEGDLEKARDLAEKYRYHIGEDERITQLLEETKSKHEEKEKELAIIERQQKKIKKQERKEDFKDFVYTNILQIGIGVVIIVFLISFFIFRHPYIELKRDLHFSYDNLNRRQQENAQLKGDLAAKTKALSGLRTAFAEDVKKVEGKVPLLVAEVKMGNTDKNGKIETDFGKPIYSSSSKYLTPQIMVYGFKDEEIELKIKLYSKNGIQRRGESSPQGYTYTSKVQCTKNEFTTCRLGGWGSDTRGYWNSDTYRLEIWYKDICLKKHDFTIY